MTRRFLVGAAVAALATGIATSAMAFDCGSAGRSHGSGFHRGSLHGHSHDLAGHRSFHSRVRHGGFGHGWHHDLRERRVVSGHSGWGYGPGYDGGYYEGVAPFGRFVGRPNTGGATFFIGF